MVGAVSRMKKTAIRLVPLILLAALLQGCAGPRAVTGLASPTQSDARYLSTIPFLVATTRAASATPEPPYSRDRSLALNFSQVNVLVPAAHRPGSVETSSDIPDPARHFSARNLTPIADSKSFLSLLNARLAERPPSQREIFIFVHGYNNNFAEGLFRNAQIVHDYNISSVPLHFSWASAASFSGYLFDRDSALLARNGLAETIEIAARSNASGIVIVGHSMGSYVVMEALRTLALRGESRIFPRIRGVMLAAPDIDPDVFSSQVDDIPVLPQPFTVIVSRRDRALNISRRLTGGGHRIGSGFNIPLLQKKNVQVIDISDVDGGGHSGFASSGTLIKLLGSDRLLRRLMTDEDATANGKVAEAGQAVFENAALAIHLPVRILEGLSTGQSRPVLDGGNVSR
ncbi:alpha/beta hydrolase [Mesorhizobium sp. 113-3-9]|uniref:alpha/beta hydrolase n=1 Tax=Mesorhizobium sp. 113-3-9 TaxID=2744517 RepID=UPI001FD0DD3A|nr:alpha/beta hydrolase [Mesorhizobium sp. 113-3-9]